MQLVLIHYLTQPLFSQYRACNSPSLWRFRACWQHPMRERSRLRMAGQVRIIHHISIEKPLFSQDPYTSSHQRSQTKRDTSNDERCYDGISLKSSYHGRKCCSRVCVSESISVEELFCRILENVDMEGSASDLLTCRVIGTCLKVVNEPCIPLPYGKPSKPILTIDRVPHDRYTFRYCYTEPFNRPFRQVGLGSLLTSRSIQLLNEDEDPEAVRRGYWVALRAEIYQQARSIGCNLIVGYSESVTVNEGDNYAKKACL